MSPRAGKRCLMLMILTDLPTQAAARANPNTDTGKSMRLAKGTWGKQTPKR